MPVKPIIDIEQFQADIKIAERDLDSGFRDQAGFVAYYATLHFKAMQQASAKKMLLDLKEAQLDKEYRDLAATEGRKITEKQVEQEIIRTVSYVAARNEYNEANAILELVKNALNAFSQRRDMLIQMGATNRQETKGELRSSGGSIADYKRNVAAKEAEPAELV